MDRELALKFQQRWPVWFRHLYGDTRITSLSFGFEHPNGWFNLVWRLCEQIEPIVEAGRADTREWKAPLDATRQPMFEVYQCKQKFGALCFYRNITAKRFMRWWARQKKNLCGSAMSAASREFCASAVS